MQHISVAAIKLAFYDNVTLLYKINCMLCTITGLSMEISCSYFEYIYYLKLPVCCTDSLTHYSSYGLLHNPLFKSSMTCDCRYNIIH